MKAALEEIADHPEITLSRREILRFILVEPTKRSEEIQTILKLEEIGQTATLRAPRVGRQNRRRKANALATLLDAVTHTRTTNGDRTDAGHDLALGQMPVAHDPLVTVGGKLVGMATE